MNIFVLVPPGRLCPLEECRSCAWVWLTWHAAHNFTHMMWTHTHTHSYAKYAAGHLILWILTWKVSLFLCVCVCVSTLLRTGALWEHDPGLLPGGGGSPRSVWRDQGVHIRGRAEVEGWSGFKGQMLQSGTRLWATSETQTTHRIHCVVQGLGV